MQLSIILRDYKPLYENGSWERTTAMLFREDYDILDGLWQDLVTHGRFREPVVLDRETRTVLDGTHRIVAAQIFNKEDIETVFDYDEEPSLSLFATLQWYNVKEEISENIQDEFFTSIRSFRVNEYTWAESSSMMGAVGYDGTSIHYTFPQTVSVEDCEQFRTLFIERLEEFLAEHYVRSDFALDLSFDWREYSDDDLDGVLSGD